MTLQLRRILLIKAEQGRENAKTFLSSHPDIMQEVEEKVRALYIDNNNDEEEPKEPQE